MRLLGVWLQPPNRFGKQDWLLQRAWRESLSAAGIDFDRIEIVDETRFWMAIARIRENAERQKRARAKRRERVAMEQPQCDYQGRTLRNSTLTEQLRFVSHSTPGGDEEACRRRKLDQEGISNSIRWRK
jgi:hypothetical protein